MPQVQAWCCFAVIGLKWWIWLLIWVSCGVLTATVLAAVATTAFISAGVGLDPLLHAWNQRFPTRSRASSNPLVLADGLCSGVGQSLDMSLVAISVLAVTPLGSKGRVPTRALSNVALTAILLSTLPLLENLLILQHALQFSFDRLKWIVPGGIATVFVSCEYTSRLAAIPVALVVAASFAGLVVCAGQLVGLTRSPNAQANKTAND